MTLLKRIAALWNRLEPAGWGAVLAAHGLKIPRKADPAGLARLLAAPLKVDRTRPGFGEFAADGARGVEPGRPSRSLLYYALACPQVRTDPDGEPIAAFATPAELEAVENYVFAARGWSLDAVRDAAARLAGSPRPALAVVVYATEFRPAASTPHRRHADLCFARTGVARTGVAAPYYDPAERGFVYRRADDDPAAIRVAPVRYSAWIAVALRGSAERFLPMDHNAMRDYADEYRPPFLPESRYKTMFLPQPGDDAQRTFWVPVHKLFAGDECLRSGGRPRPLTVRLTARHLNVKLAKLFAYLKAAIDPDRLTRPPFVETDGLAGFSAEADHGDGLLVPVAHPHLVAPALDGDRFLTIPVPPATALRQMGALKTPQVPGPRGEYRTVPGYAHIRHELRDGTFVNLNEAFPNPLDLLNYLTAGNYRAVAYRDYTADGYVEVAVPELASELPERRSAYSLVAPPDLFPRIDQRRLMELKGEIDRAWFVPPLALSDIRVPVNVELDGAGFDPTDTTATAIVGMADAVPDGSAPVSGPPPDSPRHTSLPDDAAGIFHPGWDVGLTYNGVYEHLTNDTLGSPFPEDVKLCAAISSYWPGVVPDAARVFPPIAPTAAGLRVLPLLPTIIPMTDREIGLRPGTTAWDGSPSPKLLDDQGAQVVEYVSPVHADYVSQSLGAGFSLVETSKLDFAGYRARVLAMQGVYRAVGVPPGPPPADDNTPDPRAFWLVYSFREAEPADFECVTFEGSRDRVFHVAIFRHGPVQPIPGRPVRFRVAVQDNLMRRFLASDTEVVELT
jgi:hypothetical protein